MQENLLEIPAPFRKPYRMTDLLNLVGRLLNRE
jgi:hypothetical protein